MKRRDFIVLIVGTVAWPFAALGRDRTRSPSHKLVAPAQTPKVHPVEPAKIPDEVHSIEPAAAPEVHRSSQTRGALPGAPTIDPPMPAPKAPRAK